MSGHGHHIIVIGCSAGGLEALDEIISRIPSDAPIPATLFIVQHLAPEATGQAIFERLSRYKAFECRLARNGETFGKGRIYIAPPDNHLLVKGSTLLVTKGARENRYRPAVDPLFRSAAVSHGPSVVGVVLSGMLDDGTAGLRAIKRCGGVTVVQDPKEATYPQMPQNAVDNVKVDHCVPVAEIGPLLYQLIHKPAGEKAAIPNDIKTEALIAERVLSDVDQVNGLGDQVPYNCPNCGGVLWLVDKPAHLRYRCHTGHSFTAKALLVSQSERIEETLWVSLRMFEERKNLLNSMGRIKGKSQFAERAAATEVHIQRIRAILLAPEEGAAKSETRK